MMNNRTTYIHSYTQDIYISIATRSRTHKTKSTVCCCIHKYQDNCQLEPLPTNGVNKVSFTGCCKWPYTNLSTSFIVGLTLLVWMRSTKHWGVYQFTIHCKVNKLILTEVIVITMNIIYWDKGNFSHILQPLCWKDEYGVIHTT